MNRRRLPHRYPRPLSTLVRRSVSAVIAAVLFAGPMAATAQTPVRDAAGRFSLTAPKGWTVASQDARSVVLTVRDASVTLTVAEGADPETISRAILEQVRGQWEGFQEIKRGPVTVGGQRGTVVFSSGRNPKGVPSFFRLAAVPATGGSFVTMTSVPQERFGELKTSLEALESGVVLGATTAGDGSVRPKSAGASLSPAQERRLAALDKALEGGVLTQEEYDAKKRALLGPVGGAAPAPSGNDVPAPAAGSRPFAGIATRNLEPQEQAALRTQQGALVGQIAPGSPAEAAGVQPWDVVVAVDGTPVADSAALVQAIGRHRPGDTVTLRIVRQGQTGEIPLRLGSAPRASQ
ncbi:MAG: PDZ domain-containing protein [Burkholderiales bacterium]